MEGDDRTAGVTASDWWSGVADHWRLVFASVVGGAILALGWSLVTTPSYEALATVQVGSSDVSQTQQVAESKEITRGIMGGAAVAARVVASLGLDKPPLSLGAAEFRERISIEEPLPGTLLQARVRLPAADLAARAANAIVAASIDDFDRYWSTRRATFLKDLQAREDAAKQELDEARRRVNRLRAAARLRNPKAEVEWIQSRVLLKDQPFLDLDVAARAYVDAADRTRRAKLESAAAWRHLTPVGTALPPGRPIYPKRWLSTLLGLVLGLFAGSAAAWLLVAYGRGKGRP